MISVLKYIYYFTLLFSTDDEALAIKREVDEGPNSQRYTDYRAERKTEHERKHMPFHSSIRVWAHHKAYQLYRRSVDIITLSLGIDIG